MKSYAICKWIWLNHLRDDRGADIAVYVLPLTTLECLVSVSINVHLTTVI